MHVTMPMKCMKCGSTRNETFFVPNEVQGIRCLSCGHEKREPLQSHVVHQTEWVADGEPMRF